MTQLTKRVAALFGLRPGQNLLYRERRFTVTRAWTDLKFPGAQCALHDIEEGDHPRKLLVHSDGASLLTLHDLPYTSPDNPSVIPQDIEVEGRLYILKEMLLGGEIPYVIYEHEGSRIVFIRTGATQTEMFTEEPLTLTEVTVS